MQGRGGDAMRIAYAAVWNLIPGEAVTEKIRDQVASWQALGHAVKVFGVSELANAEELGFAVALDLIARDRSGGMLARLKSNSKAYRRLIRRIAGFAPDIVYLRNAYYHPVLAELARKFPTVLEINTLERGEAWLIALRNRQRRVQAIWALATVHLARRHAAGCVALTEEIRARYERPGNRTLWTVLPNAVNLAQRKELPARRATDGRPRICFLGGKIGFRLHYHGVDKILELARRLGDEAAFDLVGDFSVFGADAIPPNVTMHGHLGREACDAVLSRSDCALGTAALHRKGMEEACPLKLRDYLAAGLPVILPYKETALRDLHPWWMLALPNSERNLAENADRILDFARGVRGRRVPRAEVAPLIGSLALESRRAEFFREVSDRWIGGRGE